MKNNDYQTIPRLDMIINVMKNILKDFICQASLRSNMIINENFEILIIKQIRRST